MAHALGSGCRATAIRRWRVAKGGDASFQGPMARPCRRRVWAAAANGCRLAPPFGWRVAEGLSLWPQRPDMASPGQCADSLFERIVRAACREVRL